jgi:hypothetical protein
MAYAFTTAMLFAIGKNLCACMHAGRQAAAAAFIYSCLRLVLLYHNTANGDAGG